jgi:hypothetical protein
VSTQATEPVDPPVVPPAPPVDDKPDKTFTQAEVTAIATREKDEGKRSAEAAVAKELGVSVTEAKQILKAHHAAEDAKKTEADKAREAAEAEKTAAEQAKNAAAVEIFETRLERAFLKEGLELDDEKVKRVRRMVGVEAGASYEDILKDVQAVKAEFPSLFDGTGAGTPKAPNGDPGGRPPKPVKGEDKFAAGAARAAQYGKPAGSTTT